MYCLIKISWIVQVIHLRVDEQKFLISLVVMRLDLL